MIGGDCKKNQKAIYKDVVNGKYNGLSIVDELEIDANMNWIFNFRNDSLRMEHLRKLSQIENVVHVTPDIMASLVDYSEHCWAFILFDSNFTSDVSFEYVEAGFQNYSYLLALSLSFQPISGRHLDGQSENAHLHVF